jgi:hypothetical protein
MKSKMILLAIAVAICLLMYMALFVREKRDSHDIGIANRWSEIPDYMGVIVPVVDVPTSGVINWRYIYDGFPFYRWKFITIGVIDDHNKDLEEILEQVVVKADGKTASMSTTEGDEGMRYDFSSDEPSLRDFVFVIPPNTTYSSLAFSHQNINYQFYINRRNMSFICIVLPNDEM